MSQGPIAPDFGVVAPTLASSASLSGSPLSFDSGGGAILGAKSSGSPLVAGLSTVPRSEGEPNPMRVLGPVTLTEDQWDGVVLENGSANSGGLTPGGVYVQWSGGKMNRGTGLMSNGDIKWVVGIALSTTTMLVMPRRHAQAN